MNSSRHSVSGYKFQKYDIANIEIRTAAKKHFYDSSWLSKSICSDAIKLRTLKCTTKLKNGVI